MKQPKDILAMYAESGYLDKPEHTHNWQLGKYIQGRDNRSGHASAHFVCECGEFKTVVDNAGVS